MNSLKFFTLLTIISLFATFNPSSLFAQGLSSVPANTPAAREDAAIERQKVLRAADQLDLMMEEMQRLKAEVADLKKRLVDLSVENQSFKNRLTESETQRLKERNLASAAVQRPAIQPANQPAAAKVNPKNNAKPTQVALTPSNAVASAPATTSSTSPSPLNTGTNSPATANTSNNLEKGYEHVVGPGQTLWTIAKAYRQNGVKVTVEKIRKANNLKTSDSIRVGQKLFIPAG